VSSAGGFAWSLIDKTGSNLTDLATRNHNDLQSIQGGSVGDYYHLTTADVTRLANTSGTNTGDQVISDATISTTDITTNNASTTKHGFFPKLPSPTGLYLKDDLTWGSPSTSSSNPGIYNNIQPADTYTIAANYQAIVHGTYTVLGTLTVLGDLRINNG